MGPTAHKLADQSSSQSQTTGDHTPWQVSLTGMRGTFYIPQVATQEAIAAETDGMDGYSVSKPAARLIEASHDMLAALLNVRHIVSEAALTGFNWKDGDWADRLFESQRVTSDAILKARGRV